MNNEQGTQIINTIISLIAAEVQHKLEGRLKAIETRLEEIQNSLACHDKEIVALQEHIPPQQDINALTLRVLKEIDLDKMSEEVEDRLDISRLVREEVRNLDFSIEVN